jgi:hypothetical protein
MHYCFHSYEETYDCLIGEAYSIVDDAITRGEVPAGTDAGAVVSMLLAMFLGMGFYAGLSTETIWWRLPSNCTG